MSNSRAETLDQDDFFFLIQNASLQEVKQVYIPLIQEQYGTKTKEKEKKTRRWLFFGRIIRELIFSMEKKEVLNKEENIASIFGAVQSPVNLELFQIILLLQGCNWDSASQIDLVKTGYDHLRNLEKINKSDGYPPILEVAYLLAVCYRHGKGVDVNPEEAMKEYVNAYNILLSQMEKTKNNLKEVNDYYQKIKINLINSIKNYFDQIGDVASRYIIALYAIDIFLAEKKYEECQTCLQFLANQKIDDEKRLLIMEKYFKFAKEANDKEAFDYLVTSAKYGPALIDQAVKETDDAAAIDFYFSAVTTSCGSEKEKGLKGIWKCLKKMEVAPENLGIIDKIIVFAWSKLHNKQEGKLYEKFLNNLASKKETLEKIANKYHEPSPPAPPTNPEFPLIYP
ncbi:MAG: hypothetical protein EPO11_07875, partial [Gammaproteobacteria bacterium]